MRGELEGGGGGPILHFLSLSFILCVKKEACNVDKRWLMWWQEVAYQFVGVRQQLPCKIDGFIRCTVLQAAGVHAQNRRRLSPRRDTVVE